MFVVACFLRGKKAKILWSCCVFVLVRAAWFEQNKSNFQNYVGGGGGIMEESSLLGIILRFRTCLSFLFMQIWGRRCGGGLLRLIVLS